MLRNTLLPPFPPQLWSQTPLHPPVHACPPRVRHRSLRPEPHGAVGVLAWTPWLSAQGRGRKRDLQGSPPPAAGPPSPPQPSPSAPRLQQPPREGGGLSWRRQRDSWRPRAVPITASKQAPCPRPLVGTAHSPPRIPWLGPTPSPGTPSTATPGALRPCPGQGTHGGTWGAPGHQDGCRQGWVQMWVQGLVLPRCAPSPGRGQHVSSGPRTRVSPDGMWHGAGGGVWGGGLHAQLPAPLPSPHTCSLQPQTPMPQP